MSIPLQKYWTSPNGARAATRFIVFHHAAFLYAVGDATRSIYTYHRSRWPVYNAAGYHIICQQDADGIHAYQMNPHNMQAAGVANRNHECYHVCAATNFTGFPSADWLEASAQALADAQLRYPLAKIVGHTEIATPGNGTTCPGALWSAWKPDLLARVDYLLAPPPPPNWAALWGPIASPDETTWAWSIPKLWQQHYARLGKCLAPALYGDDGAVVQMFEGGDVRGLPVADKQVYEVCFK